MRVAPQVDMLFTTIRCERRRGKRKRRKKKKDPARLAAGSSFVDAMSYPGLSEYHIVCRNATAIFTLVSWCMPLHGEPTWVFWGVRHERAEYGMAQKLSVAYGRDGSKLYVQSHGTISTWLRYLQRLVQSTAYRYHYSVGST